MEPGVTVENSSETHWAGFDAQLDEALGLVKAL